MMNNQYNNQPYYGNMPYNQGAIYNGQPQQMRRTNPLSNEEIASMRNKTPFSLAITQDELTRGICFHVDENGNPTTVTEPDGSTTCTLCGATWNSNELTAEQVQEATNNILSVLQTIKLMYINFPDKAAREFYQIIPLIGKVPQLYKIAADNFRTFEGYQNGYYNGMPNPFMLFGQVVGGNGYANAFQYQQTQPMDYGAPMSQPVYQQSYQQPVYNGTAPGYAPNPFDASSYGATPMTPPQQGYAPATPQGYAYTPGVGQPVAPAAPQAQPAQPQPATTTASTAPADVTTSGNHTP